MNVLLVRGNYGSSRVRISYLSCINNYIFISYNTRLYRFKQIKDIDE